MKKNGNSLFKKHRTRLIQEGVLRSVLSGFIIGFSIMLTTALLGWFFGFGGAWLPILTFILTASVATVLLYFIKYRPTDITVARRVDALGLRERAVTMLELEGEDTTVANLQREDAKEKIAAASASGIKFRISKISIVLVLLTLILSLGATVVSGLCAQDVLPSAIELINQEEKVNITARYSATLGGKIVGNAEQELLSGESAESVVAVADYGYVFKGWSDGFGKPERCDETLSASISVTAIFEEFGLLDDEGDEDGDEAPDTPEESAFGQSGSGSGSSEGEESDPDDGEDEGGGDSSDSTGVGSAGIWNDGNQFIDGETYYRDYLDIYYEMAMQIFAETGEIPPEMREFFEKYYGGI